MNVALCEALGLDANNVYAIKIEAVAGGRLPEVVVTYRDVVGMELVETIKNYNLVLVPKTRGDAA